MMRLDRLAGWAAAEPVLFDLDDLAVSWAVVDLAMAVRDAQPIDALDAPVTGTAAGAALLRGYRSLAEFGPDQERAVPLVQRLSAAVTEPERAGRRIGSRRCMTVSPPPPSGSASPCSASGQTVLPRVRPLRACHARHSDGRFFTSSHRRRHQSPRSPSLGRVASHPIAKPATAVTGRGSS
jgi:Ser/Thr protein kinase RdoA (MazF antagonist)